MASGAGLDRPRAPRTSEFASALILLLLAGCAPGRTAIIVVVETDFLVPTELASVRAELGGAACADPSCRHDFPLPSAADVPFSFTLEPRGGDASLPFSLEVTGRDAGGTILVARRVEGGFVANETRLLRIHLDRACATARLTCDPALTCIGGACVAPEIDASLLPSVVPGRELDGLRDGAPDLDAPVEDAGTDAGSDVPGLDAPVVDAPRDVPPGVDAPGVLPRACSDLMPGSPTGLTTIDPDGSGPIAPFDAWCEMATMGGGWTLLVKVDGATSVLPYTAPAWTGGPELVTPGAPSVSRGNAIYLPYWHVPITELLMGDGAAWLLAPSMEMAATTARQAMEPGVAFSTPDAGEVEWAPVVPGLVIPSTVCRRRGIRVHLPSGGDGLDVRIGMAGSTRNDCTEPTYWYGVGATVTASGGTCTPSTATAGGARVCSSSAGERREVAAFILVFGR